ncbi:hypothetical protein BDSB_01475 [Burkholderia dolosa PC543]|nr:hypothetical protein BDSB_01475 [Burkholderia dolosa PC543]
MCRDDAESLFMAFDVRIYGRRQAWNLRKISPDGTTVFE